MKKILASLAMIVLVSSVAVGATRAYFSDTETSTSNTFTAGSLDLKVGDQDDPNLTVILDDLNPGDTKYYYWILKNTGSIAGQPSIEFSAMTNFENGCTEPEGALDSTCGVPGEGEGELGSRPYVLAKWRQPVGGGSWNEFRLTNSCGHTKLNALGGQTFGLGTFTGCGADPKLPVLNQNDEVEIQFRPWWDGRYSTPADNIAQSDSTVFDVIFHLDQVH